MAGKEWWPAESGGTVRQSPRVGTRVPSSLHRSLSFLQGSSDADPPACPLLPRWQLQERMQQCVGNGVHTGCPPGSRRVPG